MGFGFDWTHISDEVKSHMIAILQCELSLAVYRWDDVLVLYNRLGVAPNRWSPLFRRKLYEQAHYFHHPLAKSLTLPE